MGYTLSEWALARLDDDSTVAAATEEEIYAALRHGLDAAGDAREPGRD